MLAVMDSYIIQSSTALCMRKGNQSKNKTMFYPGQSAQKSKAVATIPWPGYIYPSTRHVWSAGDVLKTETEGEKIGSVTLRILIRG